MTIGSDFIFDLSSRTTDFLVGLFDLSRAFSRKVTDSVCFNLSLFGDLDRLFDFEDFARDDFEFWRGDAERLGDFDRRFFLSRLRLLDFLLDSFFSGMEIFISSIASKSGFISRLKVTLDRGDFNEEFYIKVLPHNSMVCDLGAVKEKSKDSLNDNDLLKSF